MAIKKETPLQERIQKYIRQKGGYVIKTHGDMISEPGIPDLICCYKGIFIGLEVKIGKNVPSQHQYIHCRNIVKSGGIAVIVWDIDDVKAILSFVDRWINADCTVSEVIKGVETQMIFYNLKGIKGILEVEIK